MNTRPPTPTTAATEMDGVTVRPREPQLRFSRVSVTTHTHTQTNTNICPASSYHFAEGLKLTAGWHNYSTMFHS